MHDAFSPPTEYAWVSSLKVPTRNADSISKAGVAVILKTHFWMKRVAKRRYMNIWSQTAISEFVSFQRCAWGALDVQGRTRRVLEILHLEVLEICFTCNGKENCIPSSRQVCRGLKEHLNKGCIYFNKYEIYAYFDSWFNRQLKCLVSKVIFNLVCTKELVVDELKLQVE